MDANGREWRGVENAFLTVEVQQTSGAADQPTEKPNDASFPGFLPSLEILRRALGEPGKVESMGGIAKESRKAGRQETSCPRDPSKRLKLRVAPPRARKLSVQ